MEPSSPCSLGATSGLLITGASGTWFLSLDSARPVSGLTHTRRVCGDGNYVWSSEAIILTVRTTAPTGERAVSSPTARQWPTFREPGGGLDSEHCALVKLGK